MICYLLAMGKQHLGPHVVVGYGIKIFWPGLFITSPDHLADRSLSENLSTMLEFSYIEQGQFLLQIKLKWAHKCLVRRGNALKGP